jgi:hypothetical protein
MCVPSFNGSTQWRVFTLGKGCSLDETLRGKVVMLCSSFAGQKLGCIVCLRHASGSFLIQINTASWHRERLTTGERAER